MNLKLVKNGNTKCGFCEQTVQKYFTNGLVTICTGCVKEVDMVMQSDIPLHVQAGDSK